MKHYVICENDCLIESLTKEEIVSAIAEATGNVVIPAGDAFISMIVNQNDGTNLKFWQGTNDQYNALAEISNDTIYHITDAKSAQEAYNKAQKAEETATSAEDKIDAVYQKMIELINSLGGVWFSFTDDKGNPTSEPFIHWRKDDNGNPITTPAIIPVDDYSILTDEEKQEIINEIIREIPSGDEVSY